MRRSGYTLIELLVVIAIIAILAAMIAPVMLQAKEQTRVRVCAHNLRQLGIAIARYMDDHDGYGLPSPPAEFRNQYRNPWVLYVRPLVPSYLNHSGVDFTPAGSASPYPYQGVPSAPPKWLWVCQGDTYRGQWPPAPGDTAANYPCWYNFGSSYMYPGPTAYLSGSVAEQVVGTVPRRVSQWKSPKRDMLLADNYPDLHCGAPVKRDESWLHPFPERPTWVEVKSINIIFLDLHLQMVTSRERMAYQMRVVETDNPYNTATKPPKPM